MRPQNVLDVLKKKKKKTLDTIINNRLLLLFRSRKYFVTPRVACGSIVQLDFNTVRLFTQRLRERRLLENPLTASLADLLCGLWNDVVGIQWC